MGYGVACALGFGSLVPREHFGSKKTCAFLELKTLVVSSPFP